MAMNMWMTTSVFLVAVTATTVIGSTPSQEQERERRTEVAFCCVERVHKCITDSSCQLGSECLVICSVPDGCTDCCLQYISCSLTCLQNYEKPTGTEDIDPMRDCHNQCKDRC
uniref:Ctr_98_N conopeptide n=1 Tax=Conus tribblei TaxID=101761 RepID=A0A0C9SEQ6_CONTD